MLKDWLPLTDFIFEWIVLLGTQHLSWLSECLILKLLMIQENAKAFLCGNHIYLETCNNFSSCPWCCSGKVFYRLLLEFISFII